MNVHAPALANEHRLDDATSAFAGDVIGDLAKQPKKLSPKYFYDAKGSELFEQITVLPEYYPTRTELSILRDRGGEIAKIIPKGAALIEFGAGATTKVRLCWSAASSALMCRSIFQAISSTRRPRACARIFPNSMSIRWRRISPRRSNCRLRLRICRKSASFRDRRSAISSLMRLAAFLRSARKILGEGAQMIIGVDLEKDERTLYDAYNDKAGVTARFNLNVLERINRELGGNFDLSGFIHRSIYNKRPSPHRNAPDQPQGAERARARPLFFVPSRRKHPYREQLQIFARAFWCAGARHGLAGDGILDRQGCGCFRCTRSLASD